jgi:hypothetical protein
MMALKARHRTAQGGGGKAGRGPGLNGVDVSAPKGDIVTSVLIAVSPFMARRKPRFVSGVSDPAVAGSGILGLPEPPFPGLGMFINPKPGDGIRKET